jgi:hypothetical protein
MSLAGGASGRTVVREKSLADFYSSARVRREQLLMFRPSIVQVRSATIRMALGIRPIQEGPMRSKCY